MTNQGISNGDLVRLKSLGPMMTVSNVYTAVDSLVYAEVHWFCSESKEIKTSKIPVVTLVRCDE